MRGHIVYLLLSKGFYKNPSSCETLYRKRYESVGTFHLPYSIKKNSSFFLINNKTTLQLTKIYRSFLTVDKLFHSLPSITKNTLILSTLIASESILLEGKDSHKKVYKVSLSKIEKMSPLQF